MLLLTTTIILFFVIGSVTGDEAADRAIYDDVGKFLARRRATGRTMDNEQLKWLPNSNKIALGYDPTDGDPRCYDGECVMDGFKQSIFELNYKKI